MKLSSWSLLCLTLLLLLHYTPFSLAKGRGGFGKSGGSRGRGGTHSNTGHKNSQGSSSQGGPPKQSGKNTHAGHPSQSGGYPRQQGGGYYNHHPSFPHAGGVGYRSGHINPNPNNNILSPRYGASMGYGGRGVGGGSPFSHVVQSQGFAPSSKSRGFARTAVAAAAVGAVAGMAVGYGIGRFPSPPFHFQSRQEEYHYNHYMHRKYGTQSTDTNDYSRDYKYSQPPMSYDDHMDSCMKRNDLLPIGSQNTNNKSATAKPTATVVTSGGNTTGTNGTTTPLTPGAVNQLNASPVPAAPQAGSSDEDDDTVSIVEIGYPSLIEQLKVRKCLELYMSSSEKYLMRVAGGAQGLEMGFHGLLVVVTGAAMMLRNSNMLMLLR